MRPFHTVWLVFATIFAIVPLKVHADADVSGWLERCNGALEGARHSAESGSYSDIYLHCSFGSQVLCLYSSSPVKCFQRAVQWYHAQTSVFVARLPEDGGFRAGSAGEQAYHEFRLSEGKSAVMHSDGCAETTLQKAKISSEQCQVREAWFRYDRGRNWLRRLNGRGSEP